MWHLRLGIVVPLLFPSFFQANAQPGVVFVYVGSYTKNGQQGIHLLHLDQKQGLLTHQAAFDAGPNPSYLAAHPRGHMLYAVNEVNRYQGKQEGAISAFAISQRRGDLTLRGTQPIGARGPCYLALFGEGILVASYSGALSVVPLNPEGGLGTVSQVQTHHPVGKFLSHVHSVIPDPGGRFAVVADLGLHRLFLYPFDRTKYALGTPSEVQMPKGTGPRHLRFNKDGTYAYVINELHSSVTVLEYNKVQGTLTKVQNISTLPVEFRGRNYGSEVLIHPSGQFLYAANRGHNSIAHFRIRNGRLESAGHYPTQGETPRGFGLNESGDYLVAANQGSSTVVLFHIDPQSGILVKAGPTVKVPSPSAVTFVSPRDGERPLLP